MFFSERSIRGRGIRFECYPERDAEGNSSALGEIVQELRLFSLQRAVFRRLHLPHLAPHAASDARDDQRMVRVASLMWVAAIMPIGNKVVSDD